MSWDNGRTLACPLRHAVSVGERAHFLGEESDSSLHMTRCKSPSCDVSTIGIDMDQRAARSIFRASVAKLFGAARLLALAGLVCIAASVGSEKSARAESVVPAATELPQTLSLSEALRIFRTRGLDLLIADAAMRNAEGAVKIAGAIPNPLASTSVGNAFTYNNGNYSKANCLVNGSQCSPWIYNVGISDSAAIEDTLSGKRGLRLKVARNALAAAKMSRVDAERTIALQVKSAYVQIAQAVLAHGFAKEVASSNLTTLKKFQVRYAAGAINEGDLQRIETQKLESEQAVENALYALREARVALAFLLGVRGGVPDFDVDPKILDFALPDALKDATAERLLRTAFEHRPDLLAAGYHVASTQAQIDLTKRQRFPDITVGLNYAWGGYGGVSTNGPIQAPTATLSLSAPLPVFYQLQGEIRQAEANRDLNALLQAKVTGQVVNEVSAALAGVAAARKLVERMEGPRRESGGLLQSAKGAFEVIALQYEKGAANLTDYLDAYRAYIATKVEYFNDLASYWTAVFQLEAAIAMDLH